MSLPHFYVEDQVIAHEDATVFPLRLSREDAKHARVLRLAIGEHVAVVDAAQDYFECEIVSFDDAMPMVRIAQRLETQDEGPSIVLVQGLAKGDKMDMIIRHATELGVAGFVPFVCERSIVKLDERKAAARTERWHAIAKSAAMQSGQRMVPEVAQPMPLDEVCQRIAQATAVVVCWEEAPTTADIEHALLKGLDSTLMPAHDARVAVVVGPEGGLTEHEVSALLGCNERASLVSLGPSILRTETAGIVAPALVLYELRRLARSESEKYAALNAMRGV